MKSSEGNKLLWTEIENLDFDSTVTTETDNEVQKSTVITSIAPIASGQKAGKLRKNSRDFLTRGQ